MGTTGKTQTKQNITKEGKRKERMTPSGWKEDWERFNGSESLGLY